MFFRVFIFFDKFGLSHLKFELEAGLWYHGCFPPAQTLVPNDITSAVKYRLYPGYFQMLYTVSSNPLLLGHSLYLSKNSLSMVIYVVPSAGLAAGVTGDVLCCTSIVVPSLTFHRRLPHHVGRHLHVWWKAGGRISQRHGRGVGVQHPQTYLVATDTSPAPSLRHGGAHCPRGGTGRRRAGDAGLLRLLACLQLREQSSGVQHP